MRVIFHIGQQKTGTTAIQETLRRDRPRLAEMGILYPETGHDRGLRGGHHANHNGLYLALRRGTSETQTLDEIRRELHAQIADAQPHTVLISAEAAYMAADHEPDQVLAAFDELLPGDTEIVVYLRRPDRYLSSFHQQVIRNGREVAGLHTPERLALLETTCQLDYRRAVDAYRRRYERVHAFCYEDIDDAVEQFYAEILATEPPEDRTDRANISIPAVMVDLAREYTRAHGRMSWHQVQALAHLGNREQVDLLGPANRARIVEFFGPQNDELGALIGRSSFFENLADIATVPPGAITPDEANERYRDLFDALVALPGVHELRRDCLALEAAGRHDAAAALFEVHSDRLGAADLAWFDADLAAATRGAWRIVDRRYRAEAAGQGPAGDHARRLANGVVRRGRRGIGVVRRAVRHRRPRS